MVFYAEMKLNTTLEPENITESVVYDTNKYKLGEKTKIIFGLMKDYFQSHPACFHIPSVSPN
jgi:hypothetical protein